MAIINHGIVMAKKIQIVIMSMIVLMVYIKLGGQMVINGRYGTFLIVFDMEVQSVGGKMVPLLINIIMLMVKEKAFINLGIQTVNCTKNIILSMIKL